MIFHRKPLLSGLFLLCAGCAPLLAAQPFTFSSFDFPGAATTLWGINNRGDVVGSYENPANYFHGFVHRDGKFTTIDGPGAALTEIRASTTPATSWEPSSPSMRFSPTPPAADFRDSSRSTAAI